MAGSSLLVLIDDIATVLDDVAVMSKVAMKKTAGVLGDDLAVNAEQVSGVRAERELPVVWAVAKGSFRNKLILVPAALAIAAVADWLVTILLMLGGLYLCYEGFEKVSHRFFHSVEEDEIHQKELLENFANPGLDPVEFEAVKIKGAIRTDFILSAEIIVITLGTVADADFTTRVMVVSTIAMIMTVGVYGFVAGIVKLDDAGLYLAQRPGGGVKASTQRWIGERFLDFAPWLMKALGVVGTLAMFLVGGSILIHGLQPVELLVASSTQAVSAIGSIGPGLAMIVATCITLFIGLFAGGVALGGTRLWEEMKPQSA